MKLQSVAPYPINVLANGFPTNFVRNLTPDGKYQIARILKPGGADEAESEILFEGSQDEAEAFLRAQIEKDFPGLLSQC